MDDSKFSDSQPISAEECIIGNSEYRSYNGDLEYRAYIENKGKITQASLNKELREGLGKDAKDRGFKTDKGNLYRINGNVFQGIGIDRSSLFTHIRVVLMPYWCSYYEHRSLHSFSIRVSGNWIMSGAELFDPIYPFFHIQDEIEIIRSKYLPMLDKVCDELSCCEFFDQDLPDIQPPLWANQYAILYECYKRGSLDFAREWVDKCCKCYPHGKDPVQEALEFERFELGYVYRSRAYEEYTKIREVLNTDNFDLGQIKEWHDTAVEEMKPFFKERFKIDVN